MNARAVSLTSGLADLWSLTKPRLSSVVLCTAAGGMYLPIQPVSPALLFAVMLTTAGIVGAANAFNCYIERDSDRFMRRTRNRPLPAGRMEPQVALWFGSALLAISVPGLTLATNVLTGMLGLIAFLSYVVVYTPMKRRSKWAMLWGGIPGALPPMMGYTAVTGVIDAPALVLFSILYLWQIPHFIAISMFRKDEYAAAGLKSLPGESGDDVARLHTVAYLIALVPVSLMPTALSLTGTVYLVVALLLSGGFLGVGLYGFFKRLGAQWARQLFFTSLIYITGLFAVMMADSVRM